MCRLAAAWLLDLARSTRLGVRCGAVGCCLRCAVLFLCVQFSASALLRRTAFAWCRLARSDNSVQRRRGRRAACPPGDLSSGGVTSHRQHTVALSKVAHGCARGPEVMAVVNSLHACGAGLGGEARFECGCRPALGSAVLRSRPGGLGRRGPRGNGVAPRPRGGAGRLPARASTVDGRAARRSRVGSCWLVRARAPVTQRPIGVERLPYLRLDGWAPVIA